MLATVCEIDAYIQLNQALGKITVVYVSLTYGVMVQQTSKALAYYI